MKYRVSALSVYKRDIIVEAENEQAALNRAYVYFHEGCYENGVKLPNAEFDKDVPMSIWPISTFVPEVIADDDKEVAS